jgi:sterol desaturase/sphingolipid hydroxylase (fatty acid hydroxylase superfamily)
MLRLALEWLTWPLCVVAHATPVIVTAYFAPQLVPQIASATTILLALVLMGVEQVAPHREDWSMRDDREIWRDIGHSLLYAALAVNMSRLLFLVVLARAVSAAGLADLFGVWPRRSPIWVQVLIVVIVGDLLEYVYHRLCHTYPWLWRLHAIHHTPMRLHTLKGARHHGLYALGRGAAVWLPLLVVGAPAQLVFWQFIAETITGLVAHANVRFRIPGFVHRLAVTPDFHRIHHAADPRLGNTNFGVVFSFWDIAFGTHADPLRVSVGEAGIRDDPIPRRFLDELKSPLTYDALVERRRSTPEA